MRRFRNMTKQILNVPAPANGAKTQIERVLLTETADGERVFREEKLEVSGSETWGPGEERSVSDEFAAPGTACAELVKRKQLREISEQG